MTIAWHWNHIEAHTNNPEAWGAASLPYSFVITRNDRALFSASAKATIRDSQRRDLGAEFSTLDAAKAACYAFYSARMPTDITADQLDLLLWLAAEDYSQYGECHGPPLDRLIAMGLAQVHGPGEHQVFIAKDPLGTKGMMFRAVSLTPAGWTRARQEIERALS